MNRKYRDLEERLRCNSIVDSASGCWLWIGAVNNVGYGKINFRWKGGPRKGKVRTATAHRVAFKVFKGERLTPKMVIIHLCDTPRCINPDHLIRGSQLQNVRDCVEKGRHKNGATK